MQHKNTINITVYNAETIKRWQDEIICTSKDSFNQTTIFSDYKQKKSKPEKARQFLLDLQNKPQEVCKSLREMIYTNLTNYDDEYYEQDIRTQICLYQLQFKLDLIFKNKPDADEKEEKSLTEQQYWQIKYAHLCGFLWQMYYQYIYDNHNTDETFLNLLKFLLKKTHIAENAGLPDSMYTGLSCHEHFGKLYFQFKNMSINRLKLAEDELKEEELHLYDNALTRLRDKITSNDTDKLLNDAANKLADTIDNERNASLQQKKIPAYRLYTRILNSTNDIICDPKNIKKQQQFNQFIPYVNGKASTSNKVAGAMLGVLGVILLGVSISVAIATFGAGSIFSLVGVAIATSLIAQSLSIVAGTAILGATVASFGLFKQGYPQGVNKCMLSVKNAVKRNKTPIVNIESQFELAKLYIKH